MAKNKVLIDLAINLVKRYAINHTLFAADALIAATAVKSKYHLLTYNLKDFEFIKELNTLSTK